MMRRAYLVVWSAVLLSCSGAPSSGGAKASSKSQLNQIVADTLSEEADRLRRQLVIEELDRVVDHPLRFSARSLAVEDQRLLARLLDAADTVEALQALQINPRMHEYRSTVNQSGSAEDKRLFARNHGPWCLESVDVRCSALRTQPPRVIGSGMWPADLTAAELEQLRRGGDSALLSPLTVIQRQGRGFVVAGLAEDRQLGPLVKRLGLQLQEAAELAAEPTLATFLRARARALVARGPGVWSESEADWAKVIGPWEVILAPRATPGSPALKPHLGMIVGREDAVASGQVAAYRKLLPQLESSVSRLVGRKRYLARPLDVFSNVRAVSVITATGSARLPHGASRVYRLPGEARPGKIVMLVSHQQALAKKLVAQARIMLAREHHGLVRAESFLVLSVLRLLSQDIGPHDTLEIENAQGRSTVGKALGPLAAVIGELKAELFALWFVGEHRQRLGLTAEQTRQHYATGLLALLDTLEGEPEQLEVQAAGILVGELLGAKAIRYDEISGTWSLDQRLLPRTLRALAKQVATLQLTGDQEGARKLVGRTLQPKGKGVIFVDQVDRPRLRSKEEGQKAEIKPISLTYQVTELHRGALAASPSKASGASARSAAQAPEKAVPKAQAPEKAAAPRVKAPEKAVPKAQAPEKAMPKVQAPEKAVPKAQAPEQAAPRAKAPEQAAPRAKQ